MAGKLATQARDGRRGQRTGERTEILTASRPDPAQLEAFSDAGAPNAEAFPDLISGRKREAQEGGPPGEGGQGKESPGEEALRRSGQSGVLLQGESPLNDQETKT